MKPTNIRDRLSVVQNELNYLRPYARGLNQDLRKTLKALARIYGTLYTTLGQQAATLFCNKVCKNVAFVMTTASSSTSVVVKGIKFDAKLRD